MDPRKIFAGRDDEFHSTVGEVTPAKLATFNANRPVKRSKMEKEAQLAAEKAAKAEEEAAAAYAAFVAIHGAGDDEPRAGAGGSRSGGPPSRYSAPGKGFVRAGGKESYAPPTPTPTAVASTSYHHYSPSVPPPPAAPKSMIRPAAVSVLRHDDDGPEVQASGQKKRMEMDAYLEELKRGQQEREQRLKERTGGDVSITALAAREYAPVLTGSFDSGDPLTTNVHVSNLPPHANEQLLGQLFRRYGAIGSVKIMWPRGPDAGPSGGGVGRGRILGGFVAFMRRPDAERACKAMDGFNWEGTTIRTGWGKAVPTPNFAMFEAEPYYRDGERRSRRRSASPQSRSRSGSPHHHQQRRRSPGNEHGRAREKIAEPVVFLEEGDAAVYSTDSGEESEFSRLPKGRLGPLARKRFLAMLRDLISTREKVARCMAFALEHADAAETIANILIASMLVEGTSIDKKLARLHLISDILHNSSATLPNAWAYRGLFESRLPPVFDHFGAIYRSFSGRMKAEQFRLKIANVTQAWDDWICFGPSTLEDLNGRLVASSTSEEASTKQAAVSTPVATPSAATTGGGGFKSGSFRASSFKTAAFTPAAAEATPADDEEVDGEALDVDGEVLDVDGAELDVDGAELDVDGEAIPPDAPTSAVEQRESPASEDMEMGDSDAD